MGIIGFSKSGDSNDKLDNVSSLSEGNPVIPFPSVVDSVNVL